jgi:hypothetical protein
MDDSELLTLLFDTPAPVVMPPEDTTSPVAARVGALVFEDSSQAAVIGSLQSMRCSSCRAVKSLDCFPPSCAKWRRGPCRLCRAVAAKRKPPLAKKLESARHRFKSVAGVKVADVARLLAESGIDAADGDELKKWSLEKRDNALPFSVDNAMWVTMRQVTV